MNPKDNSTLTPSSNRFLLAILLIAMAVPNAVAGEAQEHNPYTIYGMRLRSHLIPETPGTTEDLGPLVFQEIVPCRFVSTLEQDKFSPPWGGREYQMMETRTYYPKGELVSGNGWVNPCSNRVPAEALAVSLRLASIAPEKGTNLFLASTAHFARSHDGIWFAGGRNELKEANVVLVRDGFSMSTDQITHLTVDIIGFFLPDPMGAGAQGEKGDKGDRGDAGERGQAGVQGAQGQKGDRGEAGAQGEKGDRGEAGAQGEKGDRGEAGGQGQKGDRGEAGAQGQKGDRGEAGAQGEKGDRGEAGAQGQKGDRGEAGAQGDKGERGEAGAQGQKGERGEAGLQGQKGERGEAGAQGQKGDRGEAGAQGEKGDRGEAGAQGQKGDKGDAGATGAQGPAGASGPQGPAGPQGPKGEAGKAGLVASIGGPYVFPPGGTLEIHDGLVNENSFILLTYVEVSNGNALGVASISRGSFVASGSPNKPFKYVVIALE